MISAWWTLAGMWLCPACREHIDGYEGDAKRSWCLSLWHQEPDPPVGVSCMECGVKR